ncbi:hypothetical protein H072_9828 [Dactylellina haptotyla CBS 200.50]|uniref:HTH La-type RNA-binding domain-containing protein n=1 Tax=Dactylellina haptotyla (strain CBS 200.50) TaxID=1284197 RepID=S8A0U2_DACHA|nr:hypothetical protein H072_9828 [Dactylellina haptotyla CBS 200.50]
MTDTKPEEKPVEAVAAEVEETKAEEEKKERTGIVSDASVLPESDDPKEIVKQVEFYFADSNLRYDKFLYGLVGEENKWVDIALVAGFNRMRRFKNLENIKKALEESELMEMNEEKTKMRRKKAMVMMKDPKTVDKAIVRSIYAKGFGVETKTTQFDLEKFFEGTGVQVNAVRLRRDDDKVFKGSVFVEFKTVDDMKKFLDLEEKPEWEGKKMALIDPKAEDSDDKDKLPTAEKAAKESEDGIKYMTKQGFVEMKMKAIEEGKIKPKDYNKANKFDAFKKESGARSSSGNRGGRGNGRGHGRGNGRGGRGGRGNHRDQRDWRERRDDDRKGDFKDRRGGRDNRGPGRDGESKSGQQYRADGVPIIKTGEDTEKRNLKRGRDEGEVGDGADSLKRSKTDAAEEASA